MIEKENGKIFSEHHIDFDSALKKIVTKPENAGPKSIAILFVWYVRHILDVSVMQCFAGDPTEYTKVDNGKIVQRTCLI